MRRVWIFLLLFAGVAQAAPPAVWTPNGQKVESAVTARSKGKIKNVDETGAPIVVTDNPGCIMHLRGVANASNRQVRVLHLAELIDRAVAAGAST